MRNIFRITEILQLPTPCKKTRFKIWKELTGQDRRFNPPEADDRVGIVADPAVLA